jgi:hypothetical protein
MWHTTLEELKANIREVIKLYSMTLQSMMDDFTESLQECITVEGGHLLHSVFKKRTVYVPNLTSKISVIC